MGSFLSVVSLKADHFGQLSISTGTKPVENKPLGTLHGGGKHVTWNNPKSIYNKQGQRGTNYTVCVVLQHVVLPVTHCGHT